MSIVVQEAMVQKQCTQLYLSENRITSEGVSVLANGLQNNKTLEQLYLYGNRIFDLGVASLTRSINDSALKTLSLGFTGITDKSVQSLSEMLKTNRTLTHLLLSNNEIGNRGVRILAHVLIHHNTSLERLDIDLNTAVNDLSVDYLVAVLKYNRVLEGLNVSNCSLSESSKRKLRKIKELNEEFSLWL